MPDDDARPGDWTMFQFAQTGEGDVPALLRRVADTIESMGDVEVHDITFQ